MRMKIAGMEKLLIAVLLIAGLIWLLPLSTRDVSSVYNATGLVNTTVNITNAAPVVKRVVAPNPINLVGYSNATVKCNVTTFDFDNNTLKVNASFFYQGLNIFSPVDKNNHYINTSCTRISPKSLYTNWSCAFRVNFFANNGTWYCNSSARDPSNTESRNQSVGAKVNPLVALKMTDVIDYGNLPTLNISSDKIANVTNAGNRNINVTVSGYGSIPGDGYAMVCSSGAINIDNERYDRASNSPFAFMNQLTGTNTKLSNFWVIQRTSETVDTVNMTYWKIQIPPGAGGRCNGKILFTASDRRS